ncbi:MAG: ATP-grasp domain-containing protein [Planctomycetes bacterium]|nr:ATP-grasp domain-containing protein [Planctomycetota bacterium]MCW8135346.1 ATP-grasp domain-containing protein [Planctomycetota bacterium]
MARLPKVLVVMPTMWDLREFDACRPKWQGRFSIEYGTPADEDTRYDFDIAGYIETCASRQDIAGVFSSSDYPGATVAASIAQRAKLPGPDPRCLLRTSHKLVSRTVQAQAAPEATPKFCAVDPDNLMFPPEIGFPCFVKPVKGAFSLFSKSVNNINELRTHLSRPEVEEFRHGFMVPFNNMWRQHGGDEVDGRWFIAEEVLTGAQVTVEGFVTDAEPTVIGVVDSEFYPGTNSFSRFVYPSSLPARAQSRMSEIARRVITALGLKRCFFNIEMCWDGSNARIIEVNPRMCGQFGDLYQKVDGCNTYQVALELVTGGDAKWKKGKGEFGYAASVPLRLFAPAVVKAAPDAARVQEIEQRHKGALVWPEIAAGQMVNDFVFEDGNSFRYCVFNIGADTRQGLQSLQRQITSELGFKMQPL